MSLEAGIKSHLVADGTVNALIAGRVYAEAIPQNGSLPCVVVSLVLNVREEVLAGPSGLVDARVRLDCWSTSKAGCIALADAVRSGLDGELNAVGGFSVQQVYLDNQIDLSEFEGDRRDYRRSLEFVFSYTE